MKNILSLLIISLSYSVQAQVAIGKTSVTNTSVSMEFETANKGLILPWTTSAASTAGAVDGTMIYDLSDHKVKVKYATGWKDLSVDTTGTTIDPLTNIDGSLIQDSANENASAKTSIGTVTSTPGILVLEDNNKAMILPKVASPHLNIINPAPGTMAYDTTAKLLAVFNGKVWSFWRP
ncbi:hypothetical protein [Chryseobacterium populi]|uniref:Uncharacterized protein n=1 Tax=Chryseobacterium populi TaxID=1144316 RepID=J2JKC2_9FLAO|nr:hypothetical protein [Chryseobacterium populi]EJL68345.1 hypothetical protein PMI13_03740 [Chryseobacterium populi]